MNLDERATGLILRTRPLTETSLIVHWLTSDLGRLATVARGARRPKSPFRGKLDLFYLADFSFARSRRSDLHTLREARLRETHSALRQNLTCLQQASYCAMLLVQTTETETPLEGIFGLLTSLLGPLPQHSAQPLTILAFEAKLLQELGLSPEVQKTPLSPGAKHILSSLVKLDWHALPGLKPNPALGLELEGFLRHFLLLHLGKIPRGRDLALRTG